MKEQLTEKGYLLRPLKESPKNGPFAVVIKDPLCWEWGNMEPYSIGIASTGETPFGTGKAYQITFNYSAYKKSNGLYVSASGGPGSIATPFECLKFTGFEIELTFWQFKNDFRKDNNSVYYKEFVPLYEWFKSESDALSKPEQISKKKFYELKNNPNIVKIENEFYTEWIRDKNGLAEYMPSYKTVFALPEITDLTTETAVLKIVYQLNYWFWEKTRDKNNNPTYKRSKFKDPEFFIQKHRVYDQRFKAILNKDFDFKNQSVNALPYYE